jgi:hypothetical protein
VLGGILTDHLPKLRAPGCDKSDEICFTTTAWVTTAFAVPTLVAVVVFAFAAPAPGEAAAPEKGDYAALEAEEAAPPPGETAAPEEGEYAALEAEEV